MRPSLATFLTIAILSLALPARSFAAPLDQAGAPPGLLQCPLSQTPDFSFSILGRLLQPDPPRVARMVAQQEIGSLASSDFAAARGALLSEPVARYIILLIADGWGQKHIEATNAYAGGAPPYQAWTRHWITTFPQGGSYDPGQAWSDFGYVTGGVTDSAAAATALFTGVKTGNGRISVSSDGLQRLYTIADKARDQCRAAGAVSSVYIAHATPGAWAAHNDARSNGYAIADESLWGDPNTTGTPSGDERYGGGQGLTSPPLDVLIGAGHPGWQGGDYVNQAMRDKLAADSGGPGAFTFVERLGGSPDGGLRLQGAADGPTVTRLAGLFGGTSGNIEYRLADGSGHDPENPTLAEMTAAALTVLNRHANGFVLLVEGGAVDWAGHANRMDRLIGEQRGFNEAVQAVVGWVEDPNNGSSWDNTLVIVTGDHETGYLTPGPGLFPSPDHPLGPVNGGTLALEAVVASTERRASWVDLDGDAEIDGGETVYWAWNSGGHTNSLLPLYTQGVGAGLFSQYATGQDPVRGSYLDNTDVHRVMDALLTAQLDLSIAPSGDSLSLTWLHTPDCPGYQVHRATNPYFDPDGANKIAEPATSGYTDTDVAGVDVIGDVVSNYFYIVATVNSLGEISSSNRVGEFDFPIVPGN